MTLLIDALKAVEALIKQRGIKPFYKTALIFANKIYAYSKLSNKGTADVGFTGWLFVMHNEK